MKGRFVNTQSALELVCLLTFAGTLVYLVFSGAYLSYVAPRMKPYLLFSAAVLLAYAVFCAGRLFRRQYRRRAAHCFLLAVPVLLFLLPHGQISTVDSGGLLTGGTLGGLSGQTAAVASAPSSGVSSGSASAASGDPSGGQDAADSADSYTVKNDDGQAIGVIHGYHADQKSVTVSNDEFYAWCSEFFTHPDRFAGFQVTLTGYVLKDIPSLNSDEFVPARLLMSCCAADLSPCGVVCKYDRVSDLTANSWVTVTGTLRVGTYEGNPEPQVHVTSITPASEVTEYVYPY